MARRPHAKWERCPAGEFKRLAKCLQGRRQRRLFLCYLAGGTAATVALGGTLVWWLGREPSSPPSPGKITCSEVLARLKDYSDGTLGTTERQQIQEHLAYCSKCAQVFNSRG
jgi:hypothetical protein